MKKLKGTITAFILSLGLLILAACGGKSSGITADDVDMQITTINKNSATIKLTFTENENLASGAATAYVTSYKMEDGEETSPQRQDVKFSGDVYTSASVSFSSLTENQEYHFVLYVTFNKKNKKIKTITGNTTTEVSQEIMSTEDFKNNLVANTSGEFKLAADLDFSVDGEKE
ncbi:MAG: fibronectin type III domain-containing protein, partial [Acholeplasmatales bacterium]|nr:fibronectin type III domain-containing protein [Acholeplasmatales bacterium]